MVVEDLPSYRQQFRDERVAERVPHRRAELARRHDVLGPQNRQLLRHNRLLQAERLLLTGALKGKVSQADIEALKSDLAAATSTLGEAEGALKAERYSDVKAKAAAAKEKATAVKSAVDQAIQARKAGRH